MSKKHAKKSDINISITALIKTLAFLIPLLLYILFTVIIFPSPNSGFLFVGVVGSLALGFGLISVTGLIDGLYLGHTITGISVGTGSALIAISSLIMYIPPIYSSIDEQYISFYFLIWLSLLISAIWYMFFRMGISRLLRNSGINKKTTDKAMKGAKNYWWYESVNELHNLDWMYYVNKWFTILYAIATLFHLLIGWWRIASPLVLLMVCTICILDVALWIPAFLARGNAMLHRKQKADTIGIISILGFLFPLLVCVSLILYFLKM